MLAQHRTLTGGDSSSVAEHLRRSQPASLPGGTPAQCHDAGRSAERAGRPSRPPGTADWPGDIRFENVTFAYPESSAPVLRELSLRIPRDRCVGLVGVNGAGKSTILALLAGLYEPDIGAVTVAGHDLRQASASWWFGQLGALFQDYGRYPGTVAENVRLGSGVSNTDHTSLERAAAKVGFLEVVHGLPHGWSTRLGDRAAGGVELSEGQWQRLALTRALFAVEAGARVLALDEPAANLDAEGEAQLHDQLINLTTGLTTIIVSHRFATLRRADLIYVVEAGRVAEHGDHDELMLAGGLYATMFQHQAQAWRRDGY